MTKDKALTISLDFIERVNKDGWLLADFEPEMYAAITAIKEALAQPEQEPVAYPDGDVVGPCICGSWPGGKCLKCPRITTPPQREWVGLTDAVVQNIVYCRSPNIANLRKAEQLLKDKNT